MADQGRTLARRGLRAPSRQGLKYGQIPPEIAQMKAQKVELAKAALLNHERKEVEYAFNAVFNSVSASEEMVAISNFLYDMFYHREDVHLRHVSDLLLAVIPDDTTSKTEIQLALVDIRKDLGLATYSDVVIPDPEVDNPTYDEKTNEQNLQPGQTF